MYYTFTYLYLVYDRTFFPYSFMKVQLPNHKTPQQGWKLLKFKRKTRYSNPSNKKLPKTLNQNDIIVYFTMYKEMYILSSKH